MITPNPASVFGARKQPLQMAAGEHAPQPAEDRSMLPQAEAVSGEATEARATEYTLGNPELPVAQYREQIVDAVNASQAVVITAETGAGKSTQVPQFLAEAGHKVVVTQPRVVAARSVAERVREEVVAQRGGEFADFVGYRTARERGDSPDNHILFATDGLQLMRELSGRGVGEKQALVLDEVHEWNENMEVLVAWAKQRISDDPDFKVILMSATMEAGPLAEFLSGGERDVPVVDVPGRSYEVEKSEGGDVSQETIKLAQQGKNTLVFVPGKAEIDSVISQLQSANVSGATILPLHGQLESAEQRRVFQKYPGAKIVVATNVAQTSITIDDIDAVVDSGLERRKEVRNGVEGLYMRPISQADCLQRAGRAGRTKAGEYVLAQLDNNPLVPLAEREPYGTPEILRTRLDGMVLRLARNGLDATGMEFYHQPDKTEIVAAKERLQKLGALREDGGVTKIGRDMERMPVESHYARMMIEARKYGPEVQTQLAALLAVQEAGGIAQFETRSRESSERWRGLLAPGCNDSDMIKQLEVFVAAQSMSDKQKRDHDIYVKAYTKAREVLRQLRDVEKLRDQDLNSPDDTQRQQLLKCIVSGMVDHLYLREGWRGEYRDAAGEDREVSSRAMITPERMVVGTPFDLEVSTRRGRKMLHLIENPTNVPSLDLLREVAPQLFTERPHGYVMSDTGTVCERLEHVFNGHATGEFEVRPAAESAERTAYLAREAARRHWQSDEIQQVVRTISDLTHRSGAQLGSISQAQLEQAVSAALPQSAASLDEAMQYVPRFTVDDLVGREEQERIRAAAPDSVNGMALRYESGKAFIDASALDEDGVMALDPSQFTLPDGRPVGCIVSWHTRTSSVAEYQATICEKAQARRERQVAESLASLRRGYVPEELSFVPQEAAAEAMRLYDEERQRAEQEASRKAAEEEQRQREREALIDTIGELLAQNESVYLGSDLEQLDDAPDEIRDAIYEIRDRLDALKSRLENARQSLGWGHSPDGLAVARFRDEQQRLSDKLQQQEAAYRRWVAEQKQRETGSVAAVDLEALMRHFNG